MLALRHRGAGPPGLTNNARFYARRFDLQPGEVYVNPMPMFHTAGCSTLTGAALLAVNLTGATLQGVKLTGVTLQGVNLTGATSSRRT